MKKTIPSKQTKIITQTKSSITTQTKILLLLLMFSATNIGIMAAVGLSSSLNKNYSSKIDSLANKPAKQNNSFKKPTSPVDIKQRPISIEQLNKTLSVRGKLWQASNNAISQKSDTDKQKLLGLKFTDLEKKNAVNKALKNLSTKNSLPDSFDWRDQDGGINLISEIKDQGQCGSCWAFGAVGMMEGSYNAYYNKPSSFNLSEQDLISCIEPSGCNGVSTYRLDQILNQIIGNQPKVTNESCFKYKACDAQGNGTCDAGGVSCSNSYSCRVNNEFGDQTLNYITLGDVEAIKRALINDGPVMTGMIVYSDFFMYESGIYQHYDGYETGGHIVLIVGYGNYDGIDYWIVKNSWGKEWGEDGYFRIKMGDDSSLESMILYTVSQPLPIGHSEVDCRDNDKDGYCSWGVGKQPDTCPKCSEIQDCNDSDTQIFEKCNMDENNNLGSISVTSKPEYGEVYIKDLISKEFIYRGTAPITLNLTSGQREIKFIRAGYNDEILSINVKANQTQSLHFEPSTTGQFLNGWPVHADGGFAWSSPVAGDIDNDGQQEVAIVDRHGMIYVYKNNGELLPGWPRYSDGWIWDYIASVALADIDKDGFMELIVSGNFHLMVYNYDGSLKWQANTQEDFHLWSSPLVGDIDGDGSLDIIFVGEYNIHAFDNNGQQKSGWPRNFPAEEVHFGNAALSDLNNDNKMELVVGTQVTNDSNNRYVIYVFDYLGNILPGWPKIENYGIYWVNEAGCSVADINNDGQKEIIVSDTWKVYVYDIFGNLLPGWPYDLAWNNKSLSIADINGDNYLEIIVPTLHKFYALDYQANILSGFPIDLESSGIALANIDQDKAPEIIAGDWYNNLYAWNADGSLANNFPLTTRDGLIGTPLVTDLDSDGTNEIVMSSLDGYIYALKTTGINDTKNSWPMFQHDTYHTGSVNKYFEPINELPIPAIAE